MRPNQPVPDNLVRLGEHDPVVSGQQLTLLPFDPACIEAHVVVGRVLLADDIEIELLLTGLNAAVISQMVDDIDVPGVEEPAVVPQPDRQEDRLIPSHAEDRSS